MVAIATQLSERAMLSLTNAFGRDAANEIALLIGGPGDAVDITSHEIGGKAEPGFDNGPAIGRAIKLAVRRGTYQVYFPAGTFEVYSNNCLHPATAGITATDGLSAPIGSSGRGIRFIGAAQNYTILKLMRSAGNTLWFYDSQGNPGWNRTQFEHIWFQSNQNSAVISLATLSETNGFRISATVASGGVDKGFIFTCCRFDYLGIPETFTGSSNADSCNHLSCWYNNNGPIVFNNDQGLAHSWRDCHFYSQLGTFKVKSTEGSGGKGGTGSIVVHNGDFIIYNQNGDTTPHYCLEIDDDASFNRHFVFEDSRWEFRNPEARLINWPGTAATTTTAQVHFERCDLSIAQQNMAGVGGAGADTNGRRDLFVLSPNKHVVLKDCYLCNQLGVSFQDVNTSNLAGFTFQGMLEFIHCCLPYRFVHAVDSGITASDATCGLANRITQSSSFGRVIARDCYLRASGTAEGMCADFDYGGTYSRGEPQKRRQRCYLRSDNQTWPVAAQLNRTRRVPAGSIIVGAYLWEPASGVSSTAKQVLICHKKQAIAGTQNGTGNLVQINITGHGLVNGDKVFIEGVGGTTEANGYFTVSNATTNNFTLTGVTFVNAWTSGGNCYKALIESSSGRSDAEHKALMGLETAGTKFPLVVSSFADTKFWLIATAGSLATKTGGFAYVEYE